MPYKDIEAHRVYNRAYSAKHYKENKEYYKQKNKRQRTKLRKLLCDAKKAPCADCGVSYPSRVMDFHHISDDKEYNVANLIQNGSSQKLLAEIAKCVLICANCHRLRH
jgi:hypothetical protein